MLNQIFMALMMAALAGNPAVEYTTGVVLDGSGAGRVVTSTAGAVDPEYSYISYFGTTAADPGDVVQSVIVYGPAGEDDILYMIDYVDGAYTLR